MKRDERRITSKWWEFVGTTTEIWQRQQTNRRLVPEGAEGDEEIRWKQKRPFQ
jgi:hypothetical protein